MRTVKLLQIEFQKNRYRKNFLLVLAFLSIQTLFMANSMRNPTFRIEGWLLQFYNMPLLNAIFLPTMIAVLASRHMEAEHQGSMWKSLYTTVLPMHLFFVKLLYGMFTIFMLCVIQTGMLLLNGNILSFHGNADERQFFLYFISTFLISLLLYFLQSLLSFVFGNQVIPISIGLLGSLAGLFLMFLQDGLLQRLIPWGLYGATMFARMDWNAETRAIHFYTAVPSASAFLYIALWLVSLTLISILVLKKTDIDSSITPTARHGKSSSVSFGILPPELVKIKGSYVWLPLLILPAVSAVIGTFNYVGNIDLLQNGWYDLWSQHTLFLCYFFLPALIGVVNSYLWKLEHQGTNWNQLMVSITPARIIMDKFLVSWMMAIVGILWIVLLYFLCGYLVGIPMNLALSSFSDWILSGIVGIGSVCAIQLFLSLVIRNFAAPIGLAVAGGIFGLFLTSQGHPLLLPYSLLSLGMRANNPSLKIHHATFLLACLLFILLLLYGCIIYLKKCDVKTNEF